MTHLGVRNRLIIKASDETMRQNTKIDLRPRSIRSIRANRKTIIVSDRRENVLEINGGEKNGGKADMTRGWHPFPVVFCRETTKSMLIDIYFVPAVPTSQLAEVEAGPGICWFGNWFNALSGCTCPPHFSVYSHPVLPPSIPVYLPPAANGCQWSFSPRICISRLSSPHPGKHYR